MQVTTLNHDRAPQAAPTASQVPVLIVGAGPSGVVLALALRRLGVAFRIIDDHREPQQLSKSAALHARTLEVFDALGVGKRMYGEGQPVEHLVLRTGRRDRVQVDFNKLVDTRYPTMIDIPQYQTENIVRDELTELEVEIEQGVSLVDFRQHPGGVQARLRDRDGRLHEVDCGWLAGCDGVHSTVRDLLGVEFRGERYTDDWVLCDADVRWSLPRNEMTFSSSAEGIYGVFPLPGENRYRIAYTQTLDEHGKPIPPSLEDVQRSLARTGFDGEVLDTTVFSVFKLAHRQATRFRDGRVFLVGDAAHVHTPFGGQGLNLGVGDAFNLAWKIALVHQDNATDELLDSYEAERAPVAARVIRMTHVGASAMLIRKGPKSVARDWLLGFVGKRERVLARMRENLSQLAHAYPDSPVVAGRTKHLVAGQRLPDQRFFDALTRRHVRLSELQDFRRHTLLLVDTDCPQTPDFAGIAGGVARTHGGLIDVHVITTNVQRRFDVPDEVRVWIDRTRALTRLHGAGSSAVLVRPDGHLAFASQPASLARLREYLDRSPLRGTGQPAPSLATGGTRVVALASAKVNAYLIRGRRTMLVDTGFPGSADALVKRMTRAGVVPGDVSLILLTHAHPDHAGSAKALAARLGVPVALHPAEHDWARGGEGPIPPALNAMGRVIKAITKPHFEAFTPDIALHDGQRLDDFGVAGRVLHTPGHSPGSITVLLDDGQAIAGDLMAGGMAREDKPSMPFLAEDAAQVRRSIAHLLEQRPTRLFFGHGKPASGTSARARLSDAAR